MKIRSNSLNPVALGKTSARGARSFFFSRQKPKSIARRTGGARAGLPARGRVYTILCIFTLQRAAARAPTLALCLSTEKKGRKKERSGAGARECKVGNVNGSSSGARDQPIRVGPLCHPRPPAPLHLRAASALD